eukprot:gene11498-biopygen12416
MLHLFKVLQESNKAHVGPGPLERRVGNMAAAAAVRTPSLGQGLWGHRTLARPSVPALLKTRLLETTILDTTLLGTKQCKHLELWQLDHFYSIVVPCNSSFTFRRTRPTKNTRYTARFKGWLSAIGLRFQSRVSECSPTERADASNTPGQGALCKYRGCGGRPRN